MKKFISGSLFVFIVNTAYAQKLYHNIFIGSNLTATGLSIEDAGNLNYDNFKSPNYGFNIGYKLVFPINNIFSLSTGLTYKQIKNKFSRMHYDNSLPGALTSVFENISLSRVLIPVQGYFNFVNKEKFKSYFTLGADFILMNKARRNAEYYIPSTPGNYIKGTFTGNQAVRFGEGDKSIGTAIISGIGSAFRIKKRDFTAELLFSSDLSESKILTLHNIEYDSYYFGKFKGFQLTIGTDFSFKKKSE